MEVCAVQQRISKLQQSPEDQVVFILGVTNHWVTLVVHKNKYSGVCAFYLDSNNEPVLMATETQLKSLVHSREVKHIKRKGQPYSQWKKKVLYQSFVDQRDIVNLLVRCVSGETDLRGELTAQSWTKLLDSYSQLVGGKTGDSDLHLVSLIEWLEGHYPTQVISSRHFKMLSQFHPHMDKAVLVQIHKWSKECTQHSNEKNCGLENVRLFYSIVEKIKEITHEIISL